MLANDCFFNEKICPVCGKIFVYYPDHVYKIRIKTDKDYRTDLVCSWKCERKWENDLQSNNRNFRNGTEKFV